MTVAMSVAVLLALSYIMACRLAKMDPEVTRGYVAAQHGVLGFGSFASACLVAIWPEVAVLPLACGALAFFLLSRHRWDRAPDEISKPGDLDDCPHHWGTH